VTESPSQRDYELLHEFRHAIRKFLAFSEAAARAAGVDPQQHQLLLTLRARSRGHGVSVGEVADRLQIKHNSAVELIDRAERRGLVNRSVSEVDRRQVLVDVTEEGARVLSELSAAHLVEIRSVAPQLVEVLGNLTSVADANRSVPAD